MKALPCLATFGLLAVPPTAMGPTGDCNHDPRRATTLADEHYEQQGCVRHASPARRCVALILVVAVLLVAGAVAHVFAFHQPAATIAVHLNNEQTMPFAHEDRHEGERQPVARRGLSIATCLAMVEAFREGRLVPEVAAYFAGAAAAAARAVYLDAR